MANLQEVPTEELLSFHDYPAVHTSTGPQNTSAQLNLTQDSFENFSQQEEIREPLEDNPTST